MFSISHIPLFIEIPVPSQESEQSYIYVLGLSILPVSMIFLLVFAIFFVFFVLYSFRYYFKVY